MRFISALLLLTASISALAQVESQIDFRGQNAEVIEIEKNLNVVRPVPYEVPSTCTRDVPYQSYECSDVTRYREECSWVPSSEDCRTEYDRVCQTVTRTREECDYGPSREVCTERPSREVCTERPSHEVCRTDSHGEERCQTVGGGQSCQTVGGGESCTTVSGERSCHDVSYTEEECSNTPRTQCETIPGHNSCRQIPYSEEVCGYETRYNQEQYACMRTQYRDETTIKKLTGSVQVHFQTNGLVEEFPLNISISAPNAKFESFITKVTLGKEPDVLVFLRKNDVHVEETKNGFIVKGDIVFEVLESVNVAPSFPVKLKNPKFQESTSVLSLEVEGSISDKGSVEATVMANPKIGRDKKIAELKAEYPSARATVSRSVLSLNLAGMMQNNFAKKNQISIKLSAPLTVEGELLNSKKPVVEKTFKLEMRK